MELFDAKGCLSEEGLQALVGGQLDETQRLEAAEHLAYCDRCMDRYTALLTDDVLEQPPRSARGAVMGTIWIRLMQNTWGRAAVATVAAVLALTLWRAGTLEQILHTGQQLNTWLPQTTADRTGAAGQAGERQSPAAIHRSAGQAHRGQKAADRKTIRCTGCAFAPQCRHH